MTHQDIKELFHTVKQRPLPQHVAVIMDGNGRWAKKQNQPRIFGHKAGAQTVRKIVELSAELGLSYLTLYAFSAENWNRPKAEIQGIFSLLSLYLDSEKKKLHRHHIRLKVIGKRDELSEPLQKKIQKVENELKDNKGLCLILAINYGSRQEILQAVQKLAVSIEAKELLAKDVTVEHLEQQLWTKDIPDPDFLIRTSGEKRLSNFLLWQLAYGELWFTDKFWPEFDQEDFLMAITEYQNRRRRFGALDGRIS